MNTKTHQPAPNKLFDLILAVITWIAIIFQFAYSTNYFNTISYFTILSNLLIAVCLTTTLFFPERQIGKFFQSISVNSALSLYIIIVGLIYNIFLRNAWIQPFPKIYYDNVVHVVTPVLFVIRWLIYFPKGSLKWIESIKWLSFPFAYLLYSIIRGYIVKWYPYFFIDLNDITLYQLLINCLLVLILFLSTGSILILIDYVLGKRKNKLS